MHAVWAFTMHTSHAPHVVATPEEARRVVREASKRTRAARAVFSKQRLRFEDPSTGRVLPGVRRCLKAAFFPHYIVVATCRSSSNAVTGKIVDRQLGRWARTGELTSRLLTKKTRKPKKPHPLARRVKACMDKHGIVPVASQVVVRREGVATAMDLVGLDTRTGELVQVEVKTGMDTGAQSRRAGRLASPFHKMPNAPMSHALLQAAWAQAAAQASGIPIARSYVVVSSAKKSRWVAVPTTLTDPSGVDALCAGVEAAATRGGGVAHPPPARIHSKPMPWE